MELVSLAESAEPRRGVVKVNHQTLITFSLPLCSSKVVAPKGRPVVGTINWLNPWVLSAQLVAYAPQTSASAQPGFSSIEDVPPPMAGAQFAQWDKKDKDVSPPMAGGQSAVCSMGLGAVKG